MQSCSFQHFLGHSTTLCFQSCCYSYKRYCILFSGILSMCFLQFCLYSVIRSLILITFKCLYFSFRWWSLKVNLAILHRNFISVASNLLTCWWLHVLNPQRRFSIVVKRIWCQYPSWLFPFSCVINNPCQSLKFV